MKKIYASFCLLAIGFGAFAQKNNVGIGTATPDKSAILDLNSSSKGLLVPRLSLEQRGNIESPATGLLVFQTDFLSGFYYYNGKEWKPITSTEANSVASTQGTTWDITGNTLTGGEFIGSTNNQPLVFKMNNTRSGLIDGTVNNTFFGAAAGNATTGIGNTAVGAYALASNVTGSNNVAFGANALLLNTGSLNMGIGSAALFKNTTGSNNMAVGVQALNQNVTGSDNVAIGTNALYSSTSSSNVGIGSAAGFSNTGSSNIFIGNNAGYSETGSNKLYISNTNTATPLVYGDFGTAKYLAIGEVAVADRAAAATGGYRLLVKGGMMTEKIKVAVAGSPDWADYVFEPSYKLMSLDKVESFIKENKHLPNVPSADEMSKSGLDVVQTSAKLMEKIEELTLYMIEMNKEIKSLKEENTILKSKIK